MSIECVRRALGDLYRVKYIEDNKVHRLRAWTSRHELRLYNAQRALWRPGWRARIFQFKNRGDAALVAQVLRYVRHGSVDRRLKDLACDLQSSSWSHELERGLWAVDALCGVGQRSRRRRMAGVWAVWSEVQCAHVDDGPI